MRELKGKTISENLFFYTLKLKVLRNKSFRWIFIFFVIETFLFSFGMINTNKTIDKYTLLASYIILGIMICLAIYDTFYTLRSIVAVYKDCINNSNKSQKYYDKSKKYKINNLIQFYEMQKGTFDLKPSEYLEVYNKKVEDGSFYINIEEKFLVHTYYLNTLIAVLNKIILTGEIDYNYTLSNRMENIKSEITRKAFIVHHKIWGSIHLEKVIKAYSERNYESIFDNIKNYFSKGFSKYDFRKTLLVLLYVSSKKCNKEIDFLSEIGLKRLEETLKEEEYVKFIERELT